MNVCLAKRKITVTDKECLKIASKVYLPPVKKLKESCFKFKNLFFIL